MKKNSLKIIKLGKSLFNYEKKVLIKELLLDRENDYGWRNIL